MSSIERNKRRKQLKKSEYQKLHNAAYEYIVKKGLTQKETSRILNVSEQSISKWVNEGSWDEDRKARQQCFSTDSNNIKELLRLTSAKRLELELEIMEANKTGDKDMEMALRKEARALSDEMSKHNKTLLSLEKDNRLTLGVYIDVFDNVFTALREYDEELWEKTIDFQSIQIRKMTNELG